MPIGRYRITDATMALFLEGDRHIARTIPADTIITVDSEALDGDRLVDVTWNDKKVMMFAQDLRSRAVSAPEN